MCCCSEPNKDVKDSTTATAAEPTKTLATDPVCGMTVDTAKAVSLEHEGTKVYFCCQGCVTKFQADPAKYLKTKPAAPLIQLVAKESSKADYTCPMHPEVHSVRGRRVVRNAAWRWSQRPLRHPHRGRNIPAQCIRRLSATRQAPALSAGWRWSRAPSPSTRKTPNWTP